MKSVKSMKTHLHVKYSLIFVFPNRVDVRYECFLLKEERISDSIHKMCNYWKPVISKTRCNLDQRQLNVRDTAIVIQ